MSTPKPVPQTPMSELEAAITDLFGKLSPAQAFQLQVQCGFSRPTLESVMRQNAAKKQLWITRATALLGAASVEAQSETPEAAPARKKKSG